MNNRACQNRKPLSGYAGEIYAEIRDLGIISPHGHCDPHWFSDNEPFPDPANLLIVPDHYVFRLLYSQGVSLTDLGIGVPAEQREPRQIFRIFATHWHKFLGTPSRRWIEYTLYETMGVDVQLSAETADRAYDQITDFCKRADMRPVQAMDSLNIEYLATTDAALDSLAAHEKISGRKSVHKIAPCFRPDDVLNPERQGHAERLKQFAEICGEDTQSYSGFLAGLRKRRQRFIELGATATDHDVPFLQTQWLARSEIESLHAQALNSTLSITDMRRYYGHMLVEMAQMSVDDGMVMQLHVGSRRSTNKALLQELGPDIGADIPVAVNWVDGLQALLDRVGSSPDLNLLLFTMDESTYSRELAPMAGHWPCLRLGPPWWFHDSENGIRRYFDQVVETAGYWNLAGFNDDTRAFFSIPARHDLWRRGVSLHLADQNERGVLSKQQASELASLLARDLAIDAYKLKLG